jgi:hypothetical protein
MPVVAAYSAHLRTILASRGNYIAVLPRSVLQLSAKLYSLKELPLKLSSRSIPDAVANTPPRNPLEKSTGHRERVATRV